MNRRLSRTLTPERRFILACARLKTDPAVVGAAAREVDSWDLVVEEASRNHLMPLLARALSTGGSWDGIPQAIRERFQRDWQKTTAINTYFLRDAGEALRAMCGAGLSPVVLKGVALAEDVYKDIGLRAFCDLDVLVPIEDLPQAERLLADLGYLPEPTTHLRSWYFENYYQSPRYARKGGRFCIELHWDFGRRPNPFRHDVARMRARAVPALLAGVQVRRLDPEDQLIHLCLHLAWGNGFNGHFRGLVDIAEVIRRGVDWNAFCARVIETNTAQVVVPSLELATWLLEAPVDAETLRCLDAHRGSLFSRFAAMLGQSRTMTGGEGHLTLMRLLWMKRFSERVHFLRQNFGSVEMSELDNRPALFRRLAGAARRAAAPFLNHA